MTQTRAAVPRTYAAQRVRAARAWANLSQPDLAKQLDMSLASLRRIEQEARDVSTAELLHIGEVCGVPRKFMLYGFSDGKPSAQAQADALEGVIADMVSRIERHERLHTLAAERLAKLDGVPPPDLVHDLEQALRAEAPDESARG